MTRDEIEEKVRFILTLDQETRTQGFTDLIDAVLGDEAASGRLDAAADEGFDAFAFTMEYIQNAISGVENDIVGMLAGEVDVFPDEFTWGEAEELLNGLNTKLQKVLELFFPYAEQDPEGLAEIGNLVGEMKSLNALLYTKVALRPENRNSPQ